MLTNPERRAARLACLEILAGETDHMTAGTEAAMRTACDKLAAAAPEVTLEVTRAQAETVWDALQHMINVFSDDPGAYAPQLRKARAALRAIAPALGR